VNYLIVKENVSGIFYRVGYLIMLCKMAVILPPEATNELDFKTRTDVTGNIFLLRILSTSFGWFKMT
jgi:hypothetical protein